MSGNYAYAEAQKLNKNVSNLFDMVKKLQDQFEIQTEKTNASLRILDMEIRELISKGKQ